MDAWGIASRKQGIRQRNLEPVVNSSRGRGEWRSAGSAHRGEELETEEEARTGPQSPEMPLLFALQTYIPDKADHVYQSLEKLGNLQLTLPRGKPEIFHDRKCSTCRLERGLSSEEHLLLL